MVTTCKCPSKNWKKCIKQTENTSLLIVKDHHLLSGSRIIILEKLSSKELYSLLISAKTHQPTSQKHFDNLFSNVELPWKEIYLNARKATANSHVLSIIKLLIMCFIWIRSFFSSVRFSLLCVLFVIMKLKQHSMFFINAQLLNLFGTNFHYFLKQISTFLI